MKFLTKPALSILIGILAFTAVAQAEVHGLVADSYTVIENNQKFAVIDLYVDMDPGNALFAVFAADLQLQNDFQQNFHWFHSDLQGECSDGGTWKPAPSDTHPLSDSFVTIGAAASQNLNQNATLLDPNFIDSPACSNNLGKNAGWFNANPPNFQGVAKDYVLHNGQTLNSAVWIGRFTIQGIPTPATYLSISKMTLSYSSTPFGVPILTEVSGSFEYVHSFLAGDLNQDGVVDGGDLGILIGSWGNCPIGKNCAADLNGDGAVDAIDLGLLLTWWS